MNTKISAQQHEQQPQYQAGGKPNSTKQTDDKLSSILDELL